MFEAMKCAEQLLRHGESQQLEPMVLRQNLTVSTIE
jgi:hypothetical protein